MNGREALGAAPAAVAVGAVVVAPVVATAAAPVGQPAAIHFRTASRCSGVTGSASSGGGISFFTSCSYSNDLSGLPGTMYFGLAAILGKSRIYVYLFFFSLAAPFGPWQSAQRSLNTANTSAAKVAFASAARALGAPARAIRPISAIINPFRVRIIVIVYVDPGSRV